MRFGLIGAGHTGQMRARALKKTHGCDLVAVADVDLARARKAAPSSKTQLFDDYERLLTSAHADAVIVSTPPRLHEEIVVAALESGKHVICEKPLSNSVEGCRRMVEASERTGKVLTTGFNLRYFPAVQFVKHVLDSGVIGELEHVRAYAGNLGISEFKAPGQYERTVISGGALMDTGVQIIDLTRYLLGEVSEVLEMTTGNVTRLNGSEDDGFALMRSPTGKVATLHAGWSEWQSYRFHIEAYGDRGMARAYYAPMRSTVVQTKEPGGRARRRWNFYPTLNVEERTRGPQWTVEWTFRQEVADFLALCEGEAGIIADGYSGLRAAEIAHAIHDSATEKQAVALAREPVALAEAI